MGVAESGTLHHTSFVVRDLEKKVRAMAQTMAIKPWNVWTIEPAECTVHGRSVPYVFRVALAQIGGSNLELIEPISGESVYVEHLKAKGEGFHHTCIAYETSAAMRAAKAELVRQGRKIVQSGNLGAIGEFYYFEMAETASILELLFLNELPPPERTIG